MLQVILFSLLGGVISLAGGFMLLRSKKSAYHLAKYATPFAAGALLSAAFLDLIKEALYEGEEKGWSTDSVLAWALIGILVFFLMERFLNWFHHHHEHTDDTHADPAARLIIIGDTLHNALDGVAIAAAFLISTPTGIVTTLAVAAHEIPQEIVDFGLLLEKGYSRRKVLIVNALSAIATTVAAVATYALGSSENLPMPAILALTGGFFIYIATSDIIPSIHEKSKGSRLLNAYTTLLILGAVLMSLTTVYAHRYIDAGHEMECADPDVAQCLDLNEDAQNGHQEKIHPATLQDGSLLQDE
jgi:zinc and cadmium transporter